MEASFFSDIFAELDKCSINNEFPDFSIPADLNEPSVFYQSEDEINDNDKQFGGAVMDNFLKEQAERNLAISRELRKASLEAVRPYLQSVMTSAAAALELSSSYILGLEKGAELELSTKFFKLLSEEDKLIMSSALLEYRMHLGKALNEYYRAEEFTDELRERAARTVVAVDKLNEWLSQLD